MCDKVSEPFLVGHDEGSKRGSEPCRVAALSMPNVRQHIDRVLQLRGSRTGSGTLWVGGRVIEREIDRGHGRHPSYVVRCSTDEDGRSCHCPQQRKLLADEHMHGATRPPRSKNASLAIGLNNNKDAPPPDVLLSPSRLSRVLRPPRSSSCISPHQDHDSDKRRSCTKYNSVPREITAGRSKVFLGAISTFERTWMR